jgi:hypothetical protein
MRCYSEALYQKASGKQWADLRKRMTPLHRQSVNQISAELCIHVVSFCHWRKTWRLQVEVVLASEKNPEG